MNKNLLSVLFQRNYLKLSVIFGFDFVSFIFLALFYLGQPPEN